MPGTLEAVQLGSPEGGLGWAGSCHLQPLLHLDPRERTQAQVVEVGAERWTGPNKENKGLKMPASCLSSCLRSEYPPCHSTPKDPSQHRSCQIALPNSKTPYGALLTTRSSLSWAFKACQGGSTCIGSCDISLSLCLRCTRSSSPATHKAPHASQPWLRRGFLPGLLPGLPCPSAAAHACFEPPANATHIACPLGSFSRGGMDLPSSTPPFKPWQLCTFIRACDPAPACPAPCPTTGDPWCQVGPHLAPLPSVETQGGACFKVQGRSNKCVNEPRRA